jgi:hypothetical protein
MIWKWNIALCDDNPSLPEIEKTADAFETAGFNVRKLSVRKDFIDIGNVEFIEKAHIILMDMQWRNLKGIVDPSWIPEYYDKLHKTVFVENWINAITYWTGSNSIRKASPYGNWPRKELSQNEVGVWLAALISHLNSDAHIVMYSSLPENFDYGFAAGLGRFRTQTAKVVTKPEGSGLTPGHPDILPCLISLQKKHLSKPLFYAWFLEDVLFRLLLDEDPISRTIIFSDSANNSRMVELCCDNFFPQLINENRSNKISILLEYINTSTLNDEIKSTIGSATHKIGECYLQKILSLKPIDAVQLTKLVFEDAACTAAGSFPYGDIATGLLFNATLETIPENAVNVARNAREILNNQRYETPLNWLNQYWIEPVNGEYSNALDKILIRGFNMSAFNKALSALKCNCAYTQESYVMNCLQNDNFVEIEFLSKWDGITKNIFIECLKKSLGKSDSLNRGLPLSILFGLRYNAERIEVLTNTEWNCLYPSPGSTELETRNHSFNYGIRWRFLSDGYLNTGATNYE